MAFETAARASPGATPAGIGGPWEPELRREFSPSEVWGDPRLGDPRLGEPPFGEPSLDALRPVRRFLGVDPPCLRRRPEESDAGLSRPGSGVGGSAA